MPVIALVVSILISAATIKHKPNAVAVAAAAVAEIPGAIRQNAAVNAETNRLRAEIRQDLKDALDEARPAVVYNVAYPVTPEYREPAPVRRTYVDPPSSGYLGD